MSQFAPPPRLGTLTSVLGTGSTQEKDLMWMTTRNIFKKHNQRRLSGWVFDNLQSTMATFSETLYFLPVELIANLDHYNNIKLET